MTDEYVMSDADSLLSEVAGMDVSDFMSQYTQAIILARLVERLRGIEEALDLANEIAGRE